MKIFENVIWCTTHPKEISQRDALLEQARIEAAFSLQNHSDSSFCTLTKTNKQKVVFYIGWSWVKQSKWKMLFSHCWGPGNRSCDLWLAMSFDASAITNLFSHPPPIDFKFSIRCYPILLMYMYKFFLLRYSSNKGQVVVVSLAWLPAVSEKLWTKTTANKNVRFNFVSKLWTN